MGLIRLANLEADELERELEPHEVGPRALVSTESAMLVGRADGTNGPLVYLDEIPVKYLDEKRLIPYQEAIRGKNGEKRLVLRTSEWHRHEFKFDYSDKNFRGAIRAGYHLVQAKWPYESGLVEWSEFKRPIKERPSLFLDRERLLEPSDYEDDDKVTERFFNVLALEGYVKSLSNDFWEMQDRLTAASFFPALTDAFPNKVRNDDRAWLCGVCANAQAYFNELKETPEVKNLLKLTKNRRIQFTHWFAKIADTIRLYDDDTGDIMSQCEIIMDYSIYQALAGPHNKKEEKRILGKPIVEKIEDIYCGHLLKFNERINTKIKSKAKAKDILGALEKARQEALKHSF